jgi:hypothetical protein
LLVSPWFASPGTRPPDARSIHTTNGVRRNRQIENIFLGRLEEAG